MTLYTGKLGSYNLENSPLAKGGEGAVFKVVNRDDVVAKIYFNPSKELEEKLTYMSNNQPDKSVLNDIAWPLDILYDGNKFSGFIMPKMQTNKELGELYKYNPDKEPILTYQHRIIIAINICRVISAVHAAGYTFGDFNPANIGVNLNNGHVGFFDADSYHIYDKGTGKTYRCAVCLNGYVAPELIQQCKGTDYLNAPLPTFTHETDRFSLAIHIFKLLMNGFTPFNGIKETETVSSGSPGLGNQAIERDNYCFKPGNKPQSLATPDLSSFPSSIQNLFTRAFVDGRKDPSKRPTANEWESVLTNYYKNEIKQCSKDKNHFYYKNLSVCPYCEAESRYVKNLNVNRGQISFASPVNIPSSSTSRTSSSSTHTTSYRSKKNTSSTTTQTNYSSTSSQSYNYSSQNTKNRPSVVFIILLFFIVFLVGAIIYNKVSKSYRDELHSGDNITISLTDINKEYKGSSDNYYIYITFDIKDDYVGITDLDFITFVYDYNNTMLGRFSCLLKEINLQKGQTGKYEVTYQVSRYQYDSSNNELFRILYNSSNSELKFDYAVKSVEYDDGQYYTNNNPTPVNKKPSNNIKNNTQNKTQLQDQTQNQTTVEEKATLSLKANFNLRDYPSTIVGNKIRIAEKGEEFEVYAYTENDGYYWYKVGDEMWIADVDNHLTIKNSNDIPYESGYDDIGVIQANSSVPIYNSPRGVEISSTRERDLFKVYSSEQDKNTIWYEIEDGGWVDSRDDVSLIKIQGHDSYYFSITLNSNKTAHNGPGTDYVSVRELYAGNTYQVYDISNISGCTWYRISTSNEWIRNSKANIRLDYNTSLNY